MASINDKENVGCTRSSITQLKRIRKPLQELSEGDLTCRHKSHGSGMGHLRTLVETQTIEVPAKLKIPMYEPSQRTNDHKLAVKTKSNTLRKMR